MAIEIRVTPSTDRVHVGEAFSVTVEAARDTAAPERRFSRANLMIDHHWRPGGQTVGSERIIGGHATKVWQFELQAVHPGTTSIVPVVYLVSAIGLTDGGGDSVVGPATAVVILPESGAARWPWYVGIAAGLVALAQLIRLVQRRRHRSLGALRPLPPPLAEALQMLADARANRREDRTQQYFADVEKIVYGYLSRRLGRALPAMTAVEVVTLAAPFVSDQEVLEILRDVITRCSATRFGGKSIGFDEMARMEETLRGALERLDATWGKK